jgi:hypothetical protein
MCALWWTRLRHIRRLFILGPLIFSAMPLPAGGSGNVEYQLPDIPLSRFLKQHLGVHVDDHGIRLGGTGSDLWHGPNDPADTFWMITDRGPNGEISVNGETRVNFPVPEFTPFILKVKAAGGKLKIEQAMPIISGGKGVTGLSNSSRDETPYNCSGQQKLAFNPNGLDTEGLVRMPDGTFWLAEEYGPSIIHVNGNGQVLARWLPSNLNPPGGPTVYPTKSTLPELFGRRKKNRGFEGLTVSPDGKLLYVALQSPLLNPDKKAGESSRNTRILAVDPQAGKVVAEFVYRLQPAAEFGETNPAEMKVSALAMLDEHRLLALERTDDIAKIYRIDLTGATDILGSQWDQPEHQPSLEAQDEDGRRPQSQP